MDEKMMKYSVVIPTYNEAKFLPFLLSSIKKQSLQPEQKIVADKNSEDSTREIAKKYGCKVVDGGTPPEGRNSGMKYVDTDLVIFLDADVVLEDRDLFRKIIKDLENEKIDLAITYFQNLAQNKPLGRLVIFGANLRAFINKYTYKIFKRLIGGCGSLMIVKKKVYDDLNGFREELVNYEDTDFYERAVAKGYKYAVLPYRVSVSSRRYENKSIGEFLRTCFALFGYKTTRVVAPKKAEEKLKKYSEAKGELGGKQRRRCRY